MRNGRLKLSGMAEWATHELDTNAKSFEDAMKFFKSIVYNGAASDSIVETCTAMYKLQKKNHLLV